MMKRRGWILAVCYACAWNAACADQTAPANHQPEDLTGLSLEQLLEEEITPVNVLGSHTHLKGGIMLGYRYMYMDMSHNQEGTRDVSLSDSLSRYPVVHTSMSMEMHMAELMYAPSDYVTVMSMIPYAENTMHHLMDTGERTTAYSSGVGDVSFMAMINVLGNPKTKGHRLVVNAGLTAPTGAIDAKSGGKQLEYNMQLGSGTWDFQPGLTYLGESESWSWGAQVLGTVRTGMNDHDYRLGDKYRLSAWTQYKVADWFGPSARLDWHAWGNVHGADPAMNPARNPAFDATKQWGERLDFLLGLNFYISKGLLKGNRLSVEGGIPVYQNLAGPTIGVDWMITAGVSYSFH